MSNLAVAFYVLIAIALPFLGVYYRNRALWWALIPAYVMLAVVGVIALAEMAGASDNLVTAYVMFAIAVPVRHARSSNPVWDRLAVNHDRHGVADRDEGGDEEQHRPVHRPVRLGDRHDPAQDHPDRPDHV